MLYEMDDTMKLIFAARETREALEEALARYKEDPYMFDIEAELATLEEKTSNLVMYAAMAENEHGMIYTL